MRHDALGVVRSGLKSRIDSIAAQQGHLTLSRMCEQIDIIRHDAHAHGLEPVALLASTLESALAMHGMGPVLLSYLDLMRDAVESEDSSPEAGTVYLAALSSRLGH